MGKIHGFFKGKGLVKSIGLLLFFIILMGSVVKAYGQDAIVVTLGKDLSEENKSQLLELFNVDRDQIKIIEITNEEERKYLEGIASSSQIGSKAISSAYVEKRQKGEGIIVETYNLTWVTREMIANALVTAGVTDAKIIAAAPFNVSGTAALTGVLKAFESATGKGIDEDQKRIANEEIVETGRLGEKIGKKEASELIRQVKEIIIDKDINNREEIKKVIIDVSGRLNISLDKDQIDRLTRLMEQINSLNLNTEEIKEQLKGISNRINEISQNNKEVKSLLQRILEGIRALIRAITNIFS